MRRVDRRSKGFLFALIGMLSVALLLSSRPIPLDPTLPRSVLKAAENPRDIVSNNDAAADYYLLGERNLARVYIERALQEGNPDDGHRDELLTNYGDILYQLGYLEESLEAYQTALYLNPINERASTHYEIAYNRYLRHLETQISEEGGIESERTEEREGEESGDAEGERGQESDQNKKESEKGSKPQEETGQSSSDDPEENPEQKEHKGKRQDKQDKSEDENVSGTGQQAEGSTNPESDQREHSVGFATLEDYYRKINQDDTRQIYKFLFPDEGDHGEKPRLP